MNKKARLNYIHALSSQVERKKMYKAKKQWVVAGISFLVATGMGAIGSHLTTHADATQAKTQTTLPINKGSQSKQIDSAASNFHDKLVGNAASQTNRKPQISGSNTQAPSAKVSATPVSSKVSGSQVSSSNAKSSTTSNVVNSGSSKVSHNLGAIEPNFDNHKDNSIQVPTQSTKKPFMLTAQPQPLNHYNANNLKMPAYYTGKWGTATFIFNNGTLSIQNGTMSDTLPAWFNQSDGSGMSDSIFWSGYNKPMVNADYIQSIKTFNVNAPQNCTGLFSGDTQDWSGSNLVNGKSLNSFNYVKSIDLSGLNTSNTTNMSNMFHGLPYLTTLNFGTDFDTSNVTAMNGMFDDDARLQSLDLSSFNTSNVDSFSDMFFDMPSLHYLNISSFYVKPSANISSILAEEKAANGTPAGNYHVPTQPTQQILLSPSLEQHSGFSLHSDGLSYNVNDLGQFTAKMYNPITHSHASDWNDIAHNAGNWINQNNLASYTVNLKDGLNNENDGSITVQALANLPVGSTVPVDLSQLTKAYPTDEFTANGGDVATVTKTGTTSSAGTATLNVINKTEITDQGHWGNAQWILDANTLYIKNGALDTNTPSDLQKANGKQPNGKLIQYLPQINDIETSDVTAPANASNLLSQFTDANNINLSGMNFEHSYNVKNILPANTNANVTYNNSFNTALDTQEVDDSNTETSEINSDNGKISSLSTLANDNSNAIAGIQAADNKYDGYITSLNSLSNEANSIEDLSISDTTPLKSQIDSIKNSLTQASSAISWVQGSSSAITNSLANELISNGSTNSSVINSLERASNTTSQTLTDDENNLYSGKGTVYSLNSEITSLSTSANTNHTNDSTQANSNSNWITNNANSLATAYADATNAVRSLGSVDVVGLNSQINGAGRLASQISNLETEVGSNNKSGLSALTTQLSNDINGTDGKGGINSQIKDLASNEAITFTFTVNGKRYHSPVTLTESYITSSVTPDANGNYNVTNLLNVSAPEGYSVAGTYNVQIKDNNGIPHITYVQPTTQPTKSGLKRYALDLDRNLDTDQTTNDVKLKGNEAEYQGTITLDFGKNAQGQEVTKSLNYDTGNNSDVRTGNTINLLNYIDTKNVNGINIPSDLLNKNLISGFDTTGFSFNQNSSKGLAASSSKYYSNANDVFPYTITVQPSDAKTENQVNNNKDIILEFNDNPVTEHINYVYNGNNEGSTTTTGNDDSTGNWQSTTRLNQGWKLASDNNSFTFTNNGTKDVSVIPQTQKDTINYVVSDNDSAYKGNKGTIATDSSDFSGNDSRTNINGSFTINNNPKGLPSDYHVVDPSETINYDGAGHDIKIAPNTNITETINYVYNNGTKSFNEGSYKPTGTYMYQSTANESRLKQGWQLSNDNSSTFDFDGRTHNVNVEPQQKTDTITFIDNGKNSATKGKSVNTKTIQFSGNDYQAANAGNNDIKLSDLEKAVPSGYTLQNANNDKAIRFDGSNHNVNVVGVSHKKSGNDNPFSPNNTNNPDNSKNKTNPLNPSGKDSQNNGNNSDSPENPNNTNHKNSTNQNSPWDNKNSNSPFNPSNPNNPFNPNSKVNPNNINANGKHKGNDNPNNPNSPLNPNNPNSPLDPNNSNSPFKNHKGKTDPDNPQNPASPWNPNNSDSPLNPKNKHSAYNPSSANSPLNPNGTVNTYNQANGKATAIVAKYINGQYIGGYAVHSDESGLATGNSATIKAPTVDGYTLEQGQAKNFTTTMNADGSLTNGIHTFKYNVDPSQIQAIVITDMNQNSDYIDANTGSDLGKNNEQGKDAYTINASQLANLGAVGDYVNITNLLKAPTGYSFVDQNNTVTTEGQNLNNIQLRQVTKGHTEMSFALAMPMIKPASNSTKPSSSASINMNSAQLSSFADEIGTHITITPQSEVNETVDGSALNNLASEVATNNKEISSLANKPAPTATVNYNNFDNLINNGIDKLEDTINKDFKANVHEVHAKSVTPKKTVGKRTYSYLKWLRVVKPLKLYNNNHEAVRTIKPRHRITLNVKAAYKVHNHIVFKVSYKHHSYFIKANNKAIKNAYLPASKKLVGRKVRVLFNVYANRRKASGRVKTLHKGYSARIKNIVRIGSHNVTRIQLANGLWISANMNYVEVL